MRRQYSLVWSSATIGIDSLPIEIETFIAPGLPRHTVVGLPHGAVRECLDRVRASLRACELEVPRGAITINLAPADVRKDGSSFDLPVAIGLLTANGTHRWRRDLRSVVIMGELALDGAVRPVRGTLSMAVRAQKDRREALIVPADNAREASLVSGIDVYPVDTLEQAIAVLQCRPNAPEPIPMKNWHDITSMELRTLDYSDVRGHAMARRALEIAMAGGHNVLMTGPPGSGKTMLARRLPTIMPRMTLAEAIETTRIHSVRGLLTGDGVIGMRPFRAPHHTISDAGLVGGGTPPGPGEISMAHNGVLFLDELPEFKRNALESLRQPMENGFVRISRADSSVQFPARFTVIAAMNPCPCGYAGSRKTCICQPGALHRYRSRISGPLLDRFDIQIEVAGIDPESLWKGGEAGESSGAIRRRVVAARQVQEFRYTDFPEIRTNATIPARRLQTFCPLGRDAELLLQRVMRQFGLSLRAYHRILRVARTIADLTGESGVSDAAIAEAVQYRVPTAGS